MAESEGESVVDPRYYVEGKAWEDSTHLTLRRSRTFAWILTFIMAGITALALLALVLLVPLKQFEPYVVTVDKTTGFLEIARPLKDTAMQSNEAVTMMNVVRYIRARETYDPRAVKANFDLAQLLSTSQASTDLTRAYTPSNPRSMQAVYGTDTTISVNVKSVSFLNPTTATVRFSTDERRRSTSRVSHWVSIVRFRYTSTPEKNEYRFDNPLGFKVFEYRRDQESLPDAPAPDRSVQ